MKDDRIFSTGEVCQLAQVIPQTLCRWVDEGTIKPLRVGRGRGNRHLFSVRDVLAVALAAELRRRGIPYEQARSVCRTIGARSLDSLRADFRAGRRYLLVADDSIATPRLMTEAAVREMERSGGLLALHLHHAPLAVVDVALAYQNVVDALEASERTDSKREPVGGIAL